MHRGDEPDCKGISPGRVTSHKRSSPEARDRLGGAAQASRGGYHEGSEREESDKSALVTLFDEGRPKDAGAPKSCTFHIICFP